MHVIEMLKGQNSPDYSNTIFISTLLFFALPSAVALSAIGFVSPK
jgi:hypothetical protein